MRHDKDVYLILPKDIGDCMIASQHVKAVNDYCVKEGENLVIWGGKFQAGLMKIFADIDLEISEPQENVEADRVIDFNFYENELLSNFAEDTPVFTADKMFISPDDGYIHEGREVGEGCIIGKQHIYDSLSDALKDAAIIAKTDKVPYPVIPSKYKDEAFRNSILEKHNVNPKSRYAILVPVCSADRPNKRWHPDKFAEVAKQLAEEGITPLIAGGPIPEELSLTANINKISGDVSVPFHVKIDEYAAVASGAEFTLSNDTGMLHISAATGSPTVLIGDDWYLSPETWAPLQSNFAMAHVEGKSVKQLSVADVVSQTKEKVFEIKRGAVKVQHNQEVINKPVLR